MVERRKPPKTLVVEHGSNLAEELTDLPGRRLAWIGTVVLATHEPARRVHLVERRRFGDVTIDIVEPSGIPNHVVADRSRSLDVVFHALAHPARRAIIRQLSSGERNLSELAAPLEMTFPAATKHVRVLERARLVRRRRAGRQHLCRLSAAPLKDAMLWTEQFRRNWEARFEALDSLLEEMKSPEKVRSHGR